MILDSGFWILDLGFSIKDLGFKIWFRVYGSGFEV